MLFLQAMNTEWVLWINMSSLLVVFMYFSLLGDDGLWFVRRIQIWLGQLWRIGRRKIHDAMGRRGLGSNGQVRKTIICSPPQCCVFKRNGGPGNEIENHPDNSYYRVARVSLSQCLWPRIVQVKSVPGGGWVTFASLLLQAHNVWTVLFQFQGPRCQFRGGKTTTSKALPLLSREKERLVRKRETVRQPCGRYW